MFIIFNKYWKEWKQLLKLILRSIHWFLSIWKNLGKWVHHQSGNSNRMNDSSTETRIKIAQFASQSTVLYWKQPLKMRLKRMRRNLQRLQSLFWFKASVSTTEEFITEYFHKSQAKCFLACNAWLTESAWLTEKCYTAKKLW